MATLRGTLREDWGKVTRGECQDRIHPVSAASRISLRRRGSCICMGVNVLAPVDVPQRPVRTESAPWTERAVGGSPRRAVLALALIAILAGALIVVASRDGVSTGPDDAVYTGTASNVARGDGLDVPFRMYPLGTGSIGTPPKGSAAPPATPLVVYAPLQPILLSVGGDHPFGTARIESAIFFALTALLVGLIVLWSTGALWPAVAAQLVVAFSLATGPISSPGTEAFAMLLVVAAFALVLRHLERPRSWLLVVASLVIALATLQRFAAGGLIVWAVLSLRHRRRDALTLLVLSSAPLGAWFVYGQISGRSTGHVLGFHLVPNTVRAAGRSIASWVLPSDAPLPLAMLAAAIVVSFVVILVGRDRKSDSHLLLLFAGLQIVMLEIAVTFVDAGVNLEPREFIPIFVAVVLAVACAIGRRPCASARAATTLVTALFVLGGVVMLANPTHGYAKEAWVHSRVMADVRGMTAGTVVYTNAPDAVYTLAHRAVSTIPEKENFSTLETNGRFREQLDEIRTTLASRGGYVVYVRGLDRDFLPTERELVRLLHLELVRDDVDGAIYSVVAPG